MKYLRNNISKASDKSPILVPWQFEPPKASSFKSSLQKVIFILQCGRMAITRICSSSPTHSTLPSLKTPHSLLPPSRSSSSCSNKSANTVSNGVLLIAESATEAVALASAAVRAAREAVALARGVEENWFDGGCQNMVKVRRKSRRKKMMKQCEFFNEEFGAVDDLLKSKKSLHLSPSEEAEICLCLQVCFRLLNLHRNFCFLAWHWSDWINVLAIRLNEDEIMLHLLESCRS